MLAYKIVINEMIILLIRLEQCESMPQCHYLDLIALLIVKETNSVIHTVTMSRACTLFSRNTKGTIINFQ